MICNLVGDEFDFLPFSTYTRPSICGRIRTRDILLIHTSLAGILWSYTLTTRSKPLESAIDRHILVHSPKKKIIFLHISDLMSGSGFGYVPLFQERGVMYLDWTK